MSGVDLLAIVSVCVTTIICFVIRSRHGADVEELDEDVTAASAECEKMREDLDKLRLAVTDNAKAFAAFRAEVKTSMSMGRK